ncbi:MAG: hypothetical protein C4582_11175, partial [Desulfobacteraceae bacterium]
KGLAMDHRGNSVKVESIKLYPDITKLLSGKIYLKDAVLDGPSVIADALMKPGNKETSEKKEVFSASSIPARRVQINDGRFAVKGPGGVIVPVSVTGQMETTAQGISVDLKTAVIEELGFRFSGKILISSISPLILKVKSEEGTFNPSSIIDFLIKFGYLDNEMAGKIPRIKSIQAKGINLAMDKTPETEGISASLESLALDQTQIKGVAVQLKKGGAFELGVTQALLDVGSIYGWVSDNPAAKEPLDKALAQAKLKGLSAQGTLELSALSLAGNQKEPQKVNGSLDIKANGLVLKIVSEKGEEQQFTVKELESKVTVKDGKPTLQVGSFTIVPQAGGSASLSGSVSFPPDIKNLEVKASIKDFKAFDTNLNLSMEKPKGHKLTFDLGVDNPSLRLLAKGMAQEPTKKKLDLEAQFEHLQIVREGQGEDPKAESLKENRLRPFDLSVINGKSFTAEAMVRSFQFNDFPQVRNIRFDVKLENDKAILRGNLTLCDLNLAVDALMIPPSTVTTQMEGKAINVDLTSLVACFSKTLPVFLTGRVSLSAILFAKGTDHDSMIGDADGDFMITLNGCGVHRLSNLDYRLSFFLDMLKIAGMEARGLDRIDFSRASARANLQKGRLVFNSFSLTGPLMSAWGKGEFTLKDKRLKISGQVKSGFGMTKALEIDKVLAKKEA